MVLPVGAALVAGVGLGAAIGWVAGGGSSSGEPDRAAIAASGASVAASSLLGVPRRSQDAQALAVLRRAAVARTAIPWSGTQVVTTWTSSGSVARYVDLSHEPGQGTVARLQATPQDSGDVTYVPDGTGPETSSTPDGSGPLALLAATYLLRLQDGQSVAGHTTELVTALRPDGSVAARFWIDRSSGLLLRRELLDPAGRVTHSTAFIEVHAGVAATMPPGRDVASPWASEVAPSEVSLLAAGGWDCPRHLPGDLTLYDVRRSAATGAAVVHLAYSDGLVSVSVFEERGHLARAGLAGYTRATMAGRTVYTRGSDEVTWAADGIVYTVVSDTPTDVSAIVAALPGEEEPAGAWARIRRGMHRLGSWIDPLG
ncbi:MAG TPA: sigma-E factor regulatory protein RseB domain-containing protein [Actinomycetes bacterium]|nr:sigma-E factor regulatory protein RseB domain-containing protein [Actinomycetes bacterium]